MALPTVLLDIIRSYLERPSEILATFLHEETIYRSHADRARIFWEKLSRKHYITSRSSVREKVSPYENYLYIYTMYEDGCDYGSEQYETLATLISRAIRAGEVYLARYFLSLYKSVLNSKRDQEVLESLGCISIDAGIFPSLVPYFRKAGMSDSTYTFLCLYAYAKEGKYKPFLAQSHPRQVECAIRAENLFLLTRLARKCPLTSHHLNICIRYTDNVPIARYIIEKGKLSFDHEYVLAYVQYTFRPYLTAYFRSFSEDT